MRNKTLHAVYAIVLLAVLNVSPKNLNAQSLGAGNGKVEFAIGVGPMFFLGDLGGSGGVGKPFVKDVDFPMTKLAKSLYLSYHPSEAIGFRVSLNHGVLEGDDAEAPNKGGAEVDRLERNLSFKSSIWEGYIAAEIYPTIFFENFDGLIGKFRPYGVIGFGVFKMNPKANLNGEWVPLQPLHLEGQGMAEYPDSKPYKLIQQEVPMGFGFKYYVKDNMYLGLELLHRQLFTDHVDDVSADHYIDPIYFNSYLSAGDAAKASQLYYRGTYADPTQRPPSVAGYQRGDPTENDAFFSTNIRIGWRLNSAGDKASRRQLRCPVFY